tara:strand:- start:455 stop:598 length:144 start_codon:yes stop_codon:yes gene_type:complete
MGLLFSKKDKYFEEKEETFSSYPKLKNLFQPFFSKKDVNPYKDLEYP